MIGKGILGRRKFRKTQSWERHIRMKHNSILILLGERCSREKLWQVFKNLLLKLASIKNIPEITVAPFFYLAYFERLTFFKKWCRGENLHFLFSLIIYSIQLPKIQTETYSESIYPHQTAWFDLCPSGHFILSNTIQQKRVGKPPPTLPHAGIQLSPDFLKYGGLRIGLTLS